PREVRDRIGDREIPPAHSAANSPQTRIGATWRAKHYAALPRNARRNQEFTPGESEMRRLRLTPPAARQQRRSDQSDHSHSRRLGHTGESPAPPAAEDGAGTVDVGVDDEVVVAVLLAIVVEI